MAALVDLVTESGACRKGNETEYNEIQNAMRDLFEVCQRYGICAGEVQIMTAKQFGKRLIQIDSAEFPNVKTWFVNNHGMIWSLLEPEKDAAIMAKNDPESLEYKKYRLLEQKKHTYQGHYA